MPRHVIVDGSNIATEGRALPSLKQLSDAVTAFMQEFPDDVITVVVDATFGHRIDPSEVAEFDEAIAHNELVAPPAGAIGRGDSFILSIANKTKGSILTNDSYQEFHGEYPWVFDEGRLIGGKPVPNVGWVFVLRTPVRGPVSRKSVRAGRSVDKNTGRVPRASKEASLPMPIPKAPPPGPIAAKGGRGGRGPGAEAAADGQRPAEQPAVTARRGRGGRRGREAEPAPIVPVAASEAPRPAPVREEPVNDLMAFINFVEHHPVGSSVNAVVESYSSHGAYVAVGDVRGYVPLRLMSDPPARSARELGKVGDAITLVVHSFTPARRSIDMAVPAAAIKAGIAPTSVPVEPHAAETAAIAEAAVIATAEDSPAKPRKRAAKRAPAPAAAAEPAPIEAPTPRRSKRAAAVPAAEVAAPVGEVAAVPAKRAGRTAARIAANLAQPTPAVAPTKKASSKPAPAKKIPAKKTPAKQTAAKNAPAPTVAAKTPPAKKASSKPAPAKKTPAKKTPAKKAPAKQTPAKQAEAKNAPVKKAPAKKAPAKKATAKRGPAASTPTR